MSIKAGPVRGRASYHLVAGTESGWMVRATEVEVLEMTPIIHAAGNIHALERFASRSSHDTLTVWQLACFRTRPWASC